MCVKHNVLSKSFTIVVVLVTTATVRGLDSLYAHQPVMLQLREIHTEELVVLVLPALSGDVHKGKAVFSICGSLCDSCTD